MEQKILMLPVKCKGCGAVFDLFRVLQEQEMKREYIELNQFLCRHCRNDSVQEEVETGEFGDYELTLEFE